ncbi:N-acetylmuramoyl-L-alanine amidase [Synechococcus sp. BSF8S]|uniref:peptidoglycan recognition protein family protein n=1 Tax=Synechococcales TaxID=1890424 RepID=UPI001627F0B2|nr:MULTISPECIES: N-acetylmuramoyl-L-alanine amidase [unclassified Synechococcus]MBC1262424.1 N-acetylmuramoyl-L-alanine amidase [Synechococcus sp. BSF8S]MBC1265326.1 N-acetylmuramoyl-L-alanine amidase [Synechococcus sp. BSA11S]
MAPTIYLHWSATPYDWLRPGAYHTIVAGDGRVHRLHAYTIDLYSHTYRRNSNSVAICCACMGGRPDPWSMPPTEAQLNSMCREVASLTHDWGWQAGDITIQRVMTHAEAASNRDGRVMHDNYGPVIWGGTGERWDFLQLRRGGSNDGGEELRRSIREQLVARSKGAGPDASSPAIAFSRSATMQARGDQLAVEIDRNGTSWALAADLLGLYEIPYEWDPRQRRILIGSSDVAPTYRDDGLQDTSGQPMFEMALLGGQSPVILRGLVIENRAWCRVLEFAEEFGITAFFSPFALGDRRGG